MKPNDIVGSIITTNKWVYIEIVKYNGKTNNKHYYTVKFKNTGNIRSASRTSIKRKSVVDKEEQKSIRAEKKIMEFKKRKMMNLENGKGTIEFYGKACRLLAIDQATIKSGFSYYIDDVLIEYGDFENKSGSYVSNIHSVREWVSMLIDKYAPDIIALEDTYFSNNVLVYKKLSMLIGVLQVLCFENGITCLLIDAPQWKSGVGIYNHKGRTSQKKAGQLMVREMYGIDDGDDVSDAILLGKHVAENIIQKITTDTVGAEDWNI